MSARSILLALLVASCGSSSSGGPGDGGSPDAPVEARGADAPSGKHVDSGSPKDAASGDARDATPDSPRPPPVTTWSAGLAGGTIPAVAVDPSSHTLALGLVTAAGVQSLVFDAFDPAGAALWSHSVVASGGSSDAGDGGSGGAAASGVAVDGKGTALYTATTAAPADFGGGTLAAGGLVVAYDTSGDHVFSHTYPGAIARAAAVTSAGGWVVVGSFAGTVDFGGGNVGAPSPTAMFVLGLDAKGNFGGLATFPRGADASSAGDVHPSRVAIDASGAIFVAGSFDGSVDFGGPTLVGPARASGDTAAFVLKLDASMAFAAQASLHVAGSDAVTGLALDATGAPFVCGQFDQTIDCGGGHVPAQGTEDVFLCKLTSTLGYGWGEAFGDPGFAELVSADAVDPAGNVYIAGSLTGSVNFGGGLLSSAGYGVYVAKYTSAGTYVTGGIVGATVSAAALGLAAPSTGSSEVIAGQFQGSIDFGQGVFASGDGGMGAGFVAWWVL